MAHQVLTHYSCQWRCSSGSRDQTLCRTQSLATDRRCRGHSQPTSQWRFSRFGLNRYRVRQAVQRLGQHRSAGTFLPIRRARGGCRETLWLSRWCFGTCAGSTLSVLLGHTHLELPSSTTGSQCTRTCWQRGHPASSCQGSGTRRCSRSLAWECAPCRSSFSCGPLLCCLCIRPGCAYCLPCRRRTCFWLSGHGSQDRGHWRCTGDPCLFAWSYRRMRDIDRDLCFSYGRGAPASPKIRASRLCRGTSCCTNSTTWSHSMGCSTRSLGRRS